MEFWGVEVKPGQSVKCDPGDIKYLHLSQASLGESKKDKGAENVPIFVKFNDQKLVLGTLSAEKCAQISFDLVFEKEFELSHSSKNASVYFCGYKAVMQDAFGSDDDFSDDESDSEDDMQIGQITNGKLDVKVEQLKSAIGMVGKKVDASAAKPKAQMEESVKADKLKAAEDDEDEEDEEDYEDEEDEEEDDSEELSDEDEDMAKALGDSDDEDVDSEEEDKVTPKKAETGNKRPADSGSKTPASAKKAKIEKTGADGKKGQTTPAPAKEVGKKPADSDKSKQQTPKSSGSVICKSCSKNFGSENALQAHTKAKHSGGK